MKAMLRNNKEIKSQPCPLSYGIRILILMATSTFDIPSH